MLPNFGKVAGVDVLAVASRSRQSGEAVAKRTANSMRCSSGYRMT
jgi:hypothetical protein